MIDIHCHILPGVDDGATDMTQSLEMAQEAIDEGITDIIATPHHQNGTFDNPKADVLYRVTELNDMMRNEGLSLRVHPGQEIRMYANLLVDHENGDILTLNDAGQYILIEFPHDSVPPSSSRFLYDIQMAGMTPIIVHPERNHKILESPNTLYELVKNGALTQITASSVIGHFGKSIQKLTDKLIAHNLTHFVASDAHNTKQRTYFMREALAAIEDTFGMALRHELQDNAGRLLNGQDVVRSIPSSIKHKKFFGLF